MIEFICTTYINQLLFQDDILFSKADGFPKKPFPEGWKGETGLYSVGFTKLGILGTSMDAQKIAQDIENQWKSKEMHNSLSPHSYLHH